MQQLRGQGSDAPSGQDSPRCCPTRTPRVRPQPRAPPHPFTRVRAEAPRRRHGATRGPVLLAYIGNDCFTIDVCVSSAYHNVPASSKAQVGCAANLVARAKRSTYAQHFSTVPSSFVAFAVEPYGAMGEEAYGFVMTLVRGHARALFPNDAVAAGRAIHTFRQTLSLGMALALSQSLDTLRLGPRPPAASPLRRSPPRAPRHQRQSYSAADLSRSYTTTSAHRRVRATAAAAQAAAVPSQTDDSSQSADSEPDEETSSHSSQPSAHGSYVSIVALWSVPRLGPFSRVL